MIAIVYNDIMLSSPVDNLCSDNSMNISVNTFIKLYHKVQHHKMKFWDDFGGFNLNRLRTRGQKGPKNRYVHHVRTTTE